MLENEANKQRLLKRVAFKRGVQVEELDIKMVFQAVRETNCTPEMLEMCGGVGENDLKEKNVDIL